MLQSRKVVCCCCCCWAVVTRRCHAVTGDKFCTLHGQKGVATVVPDDQMVQVGGKPVDLVMGSTSVVERGTSGQPMEAWASLRVTEESMDTPVVDTSFDVPTLPREPVRALIPRGCSRYGR